MYTQQQHLLPFHTEVPGPIDFIFYVRHHGEGLMKDMDIMLVQSFFHFCQFFLSFLSEQFSNAISSEVCGTIDFKFHVRHPGESLY